MIDKVLEHIDQAKITDVLASLVRFNSANPPGNEAPVAQYLMDILAGIGLEAQVVPLVKGRANVIARLPGRRAAPALMFCGHLDTVGLGQIDWQHDPFGAEIVNGRLYGRGASDMKGGLAAVVAAIDALSHAGMKLGGDVIVAGTAGEEVDFLGARQLLASGALNGVGALVVPEPTSLRLVTAHRGLTWLRLTTQGKAAHGSMPELGVNAILHMYALIERLQHHRFTHKPHPLLRSSTVNIGTLSGGTATNIVPKRCQATVDIRTVPGQSTKDVLKEIQELIAGLEREVPNFYARVEVIKDTSAVVTDPGAPLVRAAQRATQAVLGQKLVPKGVSYTTDASVLTPPTGIPTIIFGPGETAMAHQLDEYVVIDKVVQAARFYAVLALELLATQEDV